MPVVSERREAFGLRRLTAAVTRPPQPLRFRRTTDGTFLLYSVGENGKDDGGDPTMEKGVQSSNFNWQYDHALDWVWPQPATPEDVQKFYESLSK